MRQCVGYSRFVYNFGLSMITQSWSFEGVKSSDSKRVDSIKKVFTNFTKKQSNYSWCNNYSSRIYQNSFIALKKALSNWRNPKLKAGFPQYKKRKTTKSFTVDNCAGKALVAEGNTIKIPTLGVFRLKEPIPYNCVSQTFTISEKAGKWYVSFSVDADRLVYPTQTKDIVGIDLGIKCFATLSDGTTIHTPDSIKKAKIKLSKLQWKNRNKVIGSRHTKIKSSSNARKYFRKLAKQHKRIGDIRNDFLQKTTTQLAKTYRHIKIEDLNVSGMIANHKLSEVISLLGLYKFRQMLTYKQDFYGYLLTVIDRWFPSSKTCSCCGHIQDMPLKERVFICGVCGSKIDRDFNASINIERWVDEKTLSVATDIRMVVDKKEPTPLVEAAIATSNLVV